MWFLGIGSGFDVPLAADGSDRRGAGCWYLGEIGRRAVCRASSETTRPVSLNWGFVLGCGDRQGRRKSAVDSGVSDSYATIGKVSFLIKFMVVCECKRQLAAKLQVAMITGAPRPHSLNPRGNKITNLQKAHPRPPQRPGATKTLAVQGFCSAGGSNSQPLSPSRGLTGWDTGGGVVLRPSALYH